MRKVLAIFALIALGVALSGFDLDNAIVPRDEILAGGPPKDGIPALLEPKFLSAEEAEFLKPDDRVIGIEVKGESRAYPI
jgi:hypothetical protein